MKSFVTEDGTTFNSHKAYIQSRQWEEKRKLFFASPRFWGCCVVCGAKKKLQVHHMHYKNIGKERNEDLTCLCSKCHRKFHGIAAGGKPVSHEKAAAKKRRKDRQEAKRRKNSMKYVVRGSTKIFTKAEIAEYELQRQHIREIQME